MEYRAEGAQRFPTSYTLDALRRAMTAGDILESRALSFDSEKRLHFRSIERFFRFKGMYVFAKLLEIRHPRQRNRRVRNCL